MEKEYAIGIDLGGTSAVSYTHLDVYKRQQGDYQQRRTAMGG